MNLSLTGIESDTGTGVGEQFPNLNREERTDVSQNDDQDNNNMKSKSKEKKRKLDCMGMADSSHHTICKAKVLEDNVINSKRSSTPTVVWKHLKRDNLNIDHTILYPKSDADSLLRRCENELHYFKGDLTKVRVFGKWHDIPRKQVAHGDTGLTYTFSGTTVCALPWTPLLDEIRDRVSSVTGHSFNFVLINRYNGGGDYMGEHKDDEKDLSPGHPIASLSLGQPRDFVFRHQNTRQKKSAGVKAIPNVTMELRHGMLIMMNHPTNSFWYHSLPKRARAVGVRVNMTFRKMDPSKCKPLGSEFVPELEK